MVLSQGKTDVIAKYFDNQDKLSFTDSTLLKIFEKEKKDWGFKNRTSPEHILIGFLESVFFNSKIYQDPKGIKKRIFYFRTTDELTILSAIIPGGFFSYHTAMKLHGLSALKSDAYFLTKERSVYEEARDNEISQEDIDYAFSQSQRESTNISLLKKKRIVITSGKRLDELGIIFRKNEGVNYLYTDLERTLLDIVVRPGYSGGSLNVLKAFKKSKSRVDLLKLKGYLMKAGYIYPYHQSIGFYLKRAGYPKKDCGIFRTEMEFDFYLSYTSDLTEFDEEWRIYHDL